MSDHYIVAVDHGHLRIYAERNAPGQLAPALEAVQAMDFPFGRASYTDRDTDRSGRFSSSKHQGAAPGAPSARTGMSIDERLPMEREEARRRARELAAQIDAFFTARAGATFDFAAGPELNGAVLELLSTATRQRIRRSVTKDLVNQPASGWRAHFASA